MATRAYRQTGRVVFTSKGQIVIPAPIRRRYKIRKGTTAVISEEGTRIVLEPITDEFIRSLRGIDKPKRGAKSAMRLLWADRRRDLAARS